ncbi:MAG: hypothetical protein PHH83_01915 [Patescibacteria group bacterium]|nr:hypothetical protein [Patescibacteria group bacterium]
MPEELKNLEVPEVEQVLHTENIPENFDLSKKIENISDLKKTDQQTDTSNIQSTPATLQTNFDDSDRGFVQKIENILEENLRELYINLPKEKQHEFKKKGEEITHKISLLLKEVKIQARKIIDLIIEWLSMAPGINKMFLKQEAKIKTDKIIALKNKKSN